MNFVQWQNFVMDIVNQEINNNFDWSDVSDVDWDSMWIRKLSVDEAALEVLGDSITRVAYTK